MEDQLSVTGLFGLFFGGLLAMFAALHGWRDSFVFAMILFAGFILGSLSVAACQRDSWWDDQRNLATRHRKLIISSLASVAVMQLVLAMAIRG